MLICGTKGRIRIAHPSHATTKITLYQNGLTPETKRDIVKTQIFEYALPEYKTVFPGSEGFIYQIEEVIKCLDEGRVESPNYTWREMIVVMQIMDEIKKQIGLQYPQDLKSKL